MQRFLATAICLATMGSMATASAQNVRLAVVEPQSGPVANVGVPSSKTMNYFADAFNAKGSLPGGGKFEILTFDNKASPQDSLVILKDLIDKDIRYVYQNTSSAVAAALSEAVKKHNTRNPEKPVMLLNGGSLEPSLTESLCQPYFFRFFPHTGMVMAGLVKHISKDPSIKKVYLLNQDYSFGKSVSEAARDLLKKARPDVQIVADEFHPMQKVQDFSPYAAKIKASGADAVITGNWSGDLSLLIKASKEAGLNTRFYTIFGGAFGSPAAIGLAGGGTVMEASIYHPSLAVENKNVNLEQEYLNFKKKHDSDLWFLHHETILGMLTTAMKKAGSTDPKKVAPALSGMEYQGSLGKVTMRATDHQMQHPMYVSVYTRSAKYDIEKSGVGWKTLVTLEPDEVMQPTSCKMGPF